MIRRPMRIGFATGYDPALPVRAVVDSVREVEARGWEIAFFSETIALMRDSVSALSAFALATSRLTLGCTQVVRLRSPVSMAQTAASLDELSGGRLVLGMAIGYKPDEFQLYGAALERRGARFEERELTLLAREVLPAFR